MKKIIFGFACFACLSLSACNDIETPDGKVPSQYMSIAQLYAGSYSGLFNGVPTALRIEFQGTKAILSVQNSAGNEIIPGCNSAIGDLKRISASDKNGAVKFESAIFNFEPGTCPVQGRELELSFSGAETLTARIFEDCRNDSANPVEAATFDLNANSSNKESRQDVRQRRSDAAMRGRNRTCVEEFLDGSFTRR